MTKSPQHPPFAPPYECSTWFERDRAFIELKDSAGRTVFELWDEAVTEAIEDGFLPTPHHPRPSNSHWLPCATRYAQSQGLIPT